MTRLSPDPINPALSQFLDLARWVSALAVVFDHVNDRLFVFHQGGHGLALFLPWRFCAGFGHAAVVVFFVLSGYLVGGKVIRQTTRGSFDARHYLIDRITRIYLVFLPALALVWLLDHLGLRNFGLPVYDASILKDRLSGTILLGNIASLQNFLVPPFGTNGPLGTLANEFWYYITFPLLIAPFNAGCGAARKWLCALAGAGLVLWLSSLQIEHGIGFVVWLAGAAAAGLPMRPPLGRPRTALLAFLLFVLTVRLAVRATDYTVALNAAIDLPMSLSFGFVLYALRAKPWNPLRAGRVPAANAALAGFSYSLYAVHVPVINLAAGALNHSSGYGWHRQPAQNREILLALGAVCLALAAGWLFSLMSERHTKAVRDRLHRLAGA